MRRFDDGRSLFGDTIDGVRTIVFLWFEVQKVGGIALRFQVRCPEGSIYRAESSDYAGLLSRFLAKDTVARSLARVLE